MTRFAPISSIALTAAGGGLGAISQSAIGTIADTIERIEGYHLPTSLAKRNNNPGNLIYVGQSGAVRGEGGFAAWPSYAEGRAALERQIGLYSDRGLSIASMMEIYAPRGHGSNDPSLYAAEIARSLGVPVSTALSSLTAAASGGQGVDIGSGSGIDTGIDNTPVYIDDPGFIDLWPSNGQGEVEGEGEGVVMWMAAGLVGIAFVMALQPSRS